GSGQETSIEAKELAHLQTGMAHLSAGKLQEAVREFKKVLQASASLDGVHFYLSQAHAQKNRWKEVLEHIDRAIKLDPGTAPDHNHRALIFSQQKQLGNVRKTRKAENCALNLVGKREYTRGVGLFIEATEKIGRFEKRLGTRRLREDT
ncbi:MAG: tetratricopeptide repeat protein, partial [Acidobacteria bacterium]|nr:tetratricopeptide repeat protein [Acidobacteriota bacterium]